MNRIVGKLGLAQVVIVLLLFIALLQSIQFADYNYNRQISQQNQIQLINVANETAALIQLQGNISAHTRQVLLNQFAELSKHGGFPSAEQQHTNTRLLIGLNRSLEDVNDTIASVNATLQHVQEIINAYDKANITGAFSKSHR